MTGPFSPSPTGVPSEEELLASIIDIARLHLEEAHRFDVPMSELPSRRLVADLGLDSVQLLTLAMEVENHFEIVLDDVDPISPAPIDPQGDGESVETVADLVATVRDALARRERDSGQGG